MLNINEPKGLMVQDLADGKLISKMIKDPVILRLFLEALLIDDLEQKRQSINLSEVLR